MSVNRNRPHVYVLPEDDANRIVANGFYVEIDSPRQVQILPVAGGWHRVLTVFTDGYAATMRANAHTHMVLLIDYDNSPTRLADVYATIAADVRDRVFVVGSLDNPEALKAALGESLEQIGRTMAQDCRDGSTHAFGHEHLRHNDPELVRLRASVCSWLFRS